MTEQEKLGRLVRLERETGRDGRKVAVPTLRVPDIMEFVVGPQYLNRPMLYPRQATILKIMSCSDWLLTDYDHDVIAEWEAGFNLAFRDGWPVYEGRYGLPPGTVERMQACRATGRFWFREMVVVMGRRAGKGYLSAIMTCYQLYNVLALGNPQVYFEIDPTKQLLVMTMAATKAQASATLHRDVVEMITDSPAFAPFMGKKGAGLRLRTPADLAADPDAAGSILIEPRATTASSGRGSASLTFLFDEMAWAPADGLERGADEVYRAAAPSLAQFSEFSMILLASSPGSQTGEFFAAHLRALLANDDGTPADPTCMTLQIPSWGTYTDWDQASQLPMWPGGPNFTAFAGPKISKDSPTIVAARESNPTWYQVEYEAQWQTSQFAYLDRDLVDAMSEPYLGEQLVQQHNAQPGRTYVMHCDPSTSGANFAVVVAHLDGDTSTGHVVVDVVQVYKPADYPEGRIDYDDVQEHIWRFITLFRPAMVTFDQYNSEQMIQTLNKRLMKAGVSHLIPVQVRPATAKLNWIDAQRFKTLLGQGRIHAPVHDLLRNELKFLEVKGTKVDHPTSGAVQTSDAADCLFNVTAHAMDDSTEVHSQFRATRMVGGLPRGVRPSGFDEFYPNRGQNARPNPARGRGFPRWAR